MKRREFYLELSRKLQNGETVKVWTDLEKGSHSFEEPGEGTFFEEEFAGRTQVVVFGGGHISLALEKVLKTLDLTLTVVDDRLESANRERFSEADRVLTMSYEKLSEVDFGFAPYFIIVTRGHKDDDICLRYALSVKHSYIGMIGSKGKVALTFDRLAADGISREALAEVHAPIGLKIGGNTPGEIAISIAAELVQVKNQKKRSLFSEELAQGLREERGPLVMATVIEKNGSSPGKRGARMLVNEKGDIYGTVGGGTVEYTVIQEAENFLRENTGEDLFEIREYNLSNEGAASLGMICGGHIKVLLEKL